MSRAWIFLGSVLTVIALAVGTVGVVGVLAHDEVTERTELDAAGIDRLSLRNDRGSVVVEGADVDRISVVAEVDHGLRDTSTTVRVVGSTLEVRGSCPHWSTWCEVEYRVVVPARMALDLRGTNGRLAVRDIHGSVQVEGRNGAIDLDRLGGSIRARTTNGRVEATALTADVVSVGSRNGAVHVGFDEPPSTVDATTRNGRVEVVVPETPDAYRVDLDTRHGDTEIGVRTDPTSSRTITASTSNGRARVRYPTG